MGHKSSWAQSGKIDEGLSRQPLTQLLKMNLRFLNALGARCLPRFLLGEINWHPGCFLKFYSPFNLYHEGGPENWLTHNVLSGE